MQSSSRTARDPDAADGLPRPAGALRRRWNASPWIGDTLLVSLYLLLGTFWELVTPLSSGVWQPVAPIALGIASVVIAGAALIARRRHPWAVFALIAVLAAVSLTTDTATETFALIVSVYALFVYRSARSGWAGFAIAAVLLVVVLPVASHFAAQGTLPPFPVDPAGGVALIGLLVAALAGVTVGDRRRYIGALLDRAHQLARERDQQAEIATLAERARITREVHDVVAHSLSVMISLADGAVALADRDRARSRDAVVEVADVGRRSLAEMRLLLGALGDESGSLRPNPGVRELPELLATFRTARLPVRLTTQGEPPTSLPVQNAIYRIVQEALTNALRYATDPVDVHVALEYRSDGVTIDVVDDGRLSPAQPSVGSGRGLIGIRERVRVLGGTAEAGPIADGGWRVHVVLPAGEST